MNPTTRKLKLNMPAADYHADPAVSKSDIDLLLASPQHYYDRRIHPERYTKDETPQQAFGTAFHTLVLEPVRFNLDYLVIPDDLAGRSNAKKQAREVKVAEHRVQYPDRFKEDAPDPVIVYQTEYQQLLTMYGNLRKLADAQLLEHPDLNTEVSIFWTCPETGVDCKIRTDAVVALDPALTFVLDVKTAHDASPAAFAKAVANFHYHRSVAHYTEGAGVFFGLHRRVRYLFLVVETRPPFLAQGYMLAPEAVEVGREDVLEGRRLFKQYSEADQWPGYDPEGKLMEIDLPRWVYYQRERQS